MKKKSLIIFGSILFLTVALLVFLFRVPEETAPLAAENVNVVEIKNSAFNPVIISIKKGTRVTWKNMDSISHQIISDPHPGHTDLERLYSETLNFEQIYSYTFDKEGVFGYHSEQNPDIIGKVIVK